MPEKRKPFVNLNIDKVQAIYIAKSKVGITKIVKFVLTDEID